MGKLIDTIVTTYLTLYAGVLLVAMFFMIFISAPTGRYYVEAAKTGYLSSVYQDIKYGGDRKIFTGPNAQAWEVYSFMTYGPKSDTKQDAQTARYIF